MLIYLAPGKNSNNANNLRQYLGQLTISEENELVSITLTSR